MGQGGGSHQGGNSTYSISDAGPTCQLLTIWKEEKVRFPTSPQGKDLNIKTEIGIRLQVNIYSMLRRGRLDATLEAVDGNTRVFTAVLQTEALRVGAAMKTPSLFLSSDAQPGATPIRKPPANALFFLPLLRELF